MMRPLFRCASLLVGLLLLASCRVAPGHQSARQQAGHTNAISNKHTVTDSPTLERPAPQVVPAPGP